MGNFRFYRRISIFPGLSVNISKSGPSLTVGVRGAHVTFGPRGARRSVGIPGTGIYYTSQDGYHTGLHSGQFETPVGAEGRAAADRVAQALMLVLVVGLALLVGVAIGSLSAKR